MAVLNDLSVAGNQMQVALVKKALALAFWTQWYPVHKDDKIASLWFFKTIRVRNVKFVFELIFGPES